MHWTSYLYFSNLCNHYLFVYLFFCVFGFLYVCAFIPLYPLIFWYLYIYTFVYLSISIPLFKKYYHNAISIASTVSFSTILNQTPTKRFYIAPSILIKGRIIIIIIKAIIKSFDLLPIYSWLLPLLFLLINEI